MSGEIGGLRVAALSIVSIRSDSDVIAASMAARDAARRMGFNAVDQARVATTAAELSHNIVVYAGEGSVKISQIRNSHQHGIELVFEDHGPGIADIDHVLRDSTSGIGVLGTGIASARRLMDEMVIESIVGIGTRIICRKWQR